MKYKSALLLFACAMSVYACPGEISKRVDGATGPVDGKASDQIVPLPDAVISDFTPGHDQVPKPDVKVPKPDIKVPKPDAKVLKPDAGKPVAGKWVTIQPGVFTMGSPASEKCRYSCCNAEEWRHKVTLTHKFEMLSTEVTQGDFKGVMGYNPSHFSSCGSTCPVEMTSWNEAAAYAVKLSTKAGKPACYTCKGTGKNILCNPAPAYAGKKIYGCQGYRLPTEAEWEYAYRAGTTTAFYTGGVTDCKKDANMDKIGWYSNNAGAKTHPVGKKLKNPWHLYDMAGNVWEWCHDMFDKNPKNPTASVTDPVGTVGTSPVFRGGCWHNPAGDSRAARRYLGSHGIHKNTIGFRLARSVP